MYKDFFLYFQKFANQMRDISSVMETMWWAIYQQAEIKNDEKSELFIFYITYLIF